MKNLVHKVTLIALTSLGFKLEGKINSIINDTQEAIRYAIKKSDPNLLKVALIDVSLTEKEKHWHSLLANKTMKIRKNKMKQDLANPKHKCAPNNRYSFARIGVIIGGGGTTLVSFLNYPRTSLIFPIITLTATMLVLKKLKSMSDKKNKEYFKLHPYRSPKQKYLDSINVLELIQTN